MSNPVTLIESVPAELGGGPLWLDRARLDAAKAVRERGLPHKKVEAWRFTPVRPIVDRRYLRARSEELPGWVAGRLAGDDCARIYMVNGAPMPGADTPAGVELETISALLARDPKELAGTLGQLSSAEHFAALNTAMFTDGLVIRLTRGTVIERPLHLVHVALPGDEATVSYPRVLILAEENSEAFLAETYVSADGIMQLTNSVTEVVVNPGARLEHVRVQRGGGSSHHVGELSVRQHAGSVYRSRSVSLGGAFARMDIRVTLAGEGAECQVDGVYHTDNAELCDHHTLIRHQVPHTSSSENYRGVVDGSSHAVFDGTVIVDRDAQRTSAHQENRNLLLSDNATVHTKPHLEIDADDIVASHGATVGALDDHQLFYLRTRGLDESTARAALTYGFLQEILDGIGHRPVADWLGSALRARLPDGKRIEELLL